MDQFEKVERIAQKAGVSFEVAKNALEENNWDMLDAMLALEKENKTAAQEKFSTDYGAQPGYKTVNVGGQSYTKRKKSLGEKIKILLKKSHVNHLVIRRGDHMSASLPLWAAILIILRFWKISFILFLIGLFTGCKISLEGPDMEKAEGVNKAMDKAGEAMTRTAADFKASFDAGYAGGKRKNTNSSKDTTAETASAGADAKAAEAKPFKCEPADAETASVNACSISSEGTWTSCNTASAQTTAQESTDTAAADHSVEAKAEKASDANRTLEAEASVTEPVVEKTVNGMNATQFQEKDFSEVYTAFGGNSVTTDDGKITLEL